MAVGLFVAVMAIRPPAYLQLIVVFSSSGMAAAFLMPALLGCFWRRTTAAGAIAAMSAGTAATLLLYLVGSLGLKRLGLDGLLPDTSMIGPAKGLRPYYLLGLDPCVWGLTTSLVAGVVGSLISRPPEPARVALLFDLQPPDAPAPATLDLHPKFES